MNTQTRTQMPRYGELTVAARVPVEKAEAFRRAADQRGMTRNRLLRALIADFLRDERARGEP